MGTCLLCQTLPFENSIATVVKASPPNRPTTTNTRIQSSRDWLFLATRTPQPAAAAPNNTATKDWERLSRRECPRRRWSLAQRAVRSDPVVGLLVALNQHSHLQYRVEDLPVEQLIPQLNARTLDIAVLPR